MEHTDILFDDVTYVSPRTGNVIFEHLSVQFSKGVNCIVGQNGTGKSTLLLLAAGLLLPTEGRIRIHGIDTADLQDEQERQQYVSFIFQNMEFETREPVEELLRYVYENGYYDQQESGFLEKLIDVFELTPFLSNTTQELSKGQLQRTILAFSVLYGSKIIMMDEPVFAMEDYQKQRVMDFMTALSRERGFSLYYTVHDLYLSQEYADYALLLQLSHQPVYGASQNVLTRERLEQAYEVPLPFLKQQERLYRKALWQEEKQKEEREKHHSN